MGSSLNQQFADSTVTENRSASQLRGGRPLSVRWLALAVALTALITACDPSDRSNGRRETARPSSVRQRKGNSSGKRFEKPNPFSKSGSVDPLMRRGSAAITRVSDRRCDVQARFSATSMERDAETSSTSRFAIKQSSASVSTKAVSTSFRPPAWPRFFT